MDTDNKKKPELSKAAAEKYDLKGLKPGTYDVSGFGVVDLTTISKAKADQLAKSGKFPFLVEKKVKAAAAAKPDAPADTIQA